MRYDLDGLGEYRETVRIDSVGPERTVCTTSSGGRLEIDMGTGLNGYLPRAGEFWVASKDGSATWSLSQRVTSGIWNPMSLGVTIDPREWEGRASSAAALASELGASTATVLVADDGELLYGSSLAGGLGLSVRDCGTEELVSRLSSGGLSVRLAVGCGLWDDESNPAHNRYQQAVQEPGGTRFVPLLSPAAALGAVSSIVGELSDAFESTASSIEVTGFRLWSELADVCPASVSGYGDVPDLSASGDEQDAYREHLNSVQREFAESVRPADAALPVGVSVNVGCFDPMLEDPMGRFRTGLADAFSSYGWNSVTVPVRSVPSPDPSESASSLDLSVAWARRFAEDSSARVVAGCREDPRALFRELASQQVTDVTLDSLEEIAEMPRPMRLEIASAFEESRLVEVRDPGTVGVVVSSDTMDASLRNAADALEWESALLSTCRAVSARTPFRFQVLFDVDVSDPDNLVNLVGIVAPWCLNADSTVVSTVSSEVSSGMPVVLVGTGSLSRPEGSADPARVPPAFGAFGSAPLPDGEASGEVSSPGGTWELRSACRCSRPRDGSPSDGAPIIFSNRSAFVAMDAGDPAVFEVAASVLETS